MVTGPLTHLLWPLTLLCPGLLRFPLHVTSTTVAPGNFLAVFIRLSSLVLYAFHLPLQRLEFGWGGASSLPRFTILRETRSHPLFL